MMLVHLFVVAWFFSSAFSMECDGPQWKEYLGNCYLFDNTYRTAGNCKTHCDSFGANLLCIEDANREKYILENLSSGNSVWLDFHENPNGGGFTWGDTCANTGYSDWDSIPGENALQSCGVLTKNGHWLATECDKGYFVTCSCEKPAIKAPSDETCPDGWGVDGSECYLVNVKKDPMSWQECENYCSAKNAHMPCVEDAEKDEYLVNHMRTFPKMWLSYNSIASGNEWVWAPQCSSTGYTHFDPTPPYGSTGDCAVLPRDNPDGWLQESCGAISIDPKYCVCQASASSLAVNPPPDNDDFSNDDNSTSRPKSFVTEYFPLMFGLFGGVILLVIIGSFVSPHLSKQSGMK